MFKALKEFFFGKPVEKVEAPYKVELREPVVTIVNEKVEVVSVPAAEAKPKKARVKKEKAVAKKSNPEVNVVKPAKIKKPRTKKPTM